MAGADFPYKRRDKKKVGVWREGDRKKRNKGLFGRGMARAKGKGEAPDVDGSLGGGGKRRTERKMQPRWEGEIDDYESLQTKRVCVCMATIH